MTEKKLQQPFYLKKNMYSAGLVQPVQPLITKRGKAYKS